MIEISSPSTPELVLERVVEERQPMLAQEREELLRAPEPLQQHLLALARLVGGIPAWDAHGCLRRPLRRRRDRRDHAPAALSNARVSDRDDHAFKPIGALAPSRILNVFMRWVSR